MNSQLTLNPEAPVFIRSIPPRDRLIDDVCNLLDTLATTTKQSLIDHDIDSGVTVSDATEILGAIFTHGAFMAYPLLRTMSAGRYFASADGRLLYCSDPSSDDQRFATVAKEELQETPLGTLYQMREDLTHLVAYTQQQLHFA